ncbi:hypothetical protein [Halorubrum saccharovorum]|uniref:hypothetical protein n=1 Tax=Halorubrum saccharovorum TaxID=2248 RepID=UPI0012679DFD|nr:hypothetical protein [Halorubrum saccharovorum]
MTVSSAIDTLVIAGLAPAVTLVAGAFAFAEYYQKPVMDYLKQSEVAFQSFAQNNDGEDSTQKVRNWSKKMYEAHTYRNAHGRTVKVTAAGALGWVLAYSTQILDLGSVVFSSPLGVPAPLGLKILALLAWIVAIYYGILIINKFGVRPEEVVEEEVDNRSNAD